MGISVGNDTGALSNFLCHACRLRWRSCTAMLEQEFARAQGLELYNQQMGVSAVDPLHIAAEAGDKTAQYCLGKTLRLNNIFMPPEA